MIISKIGQSKIPESRKSKIGNFSSWRKKNLKIKEK